MKKTAAEIELEEFFYSSISDSCLLCSIHRQDDFLHWPSAVFETVMEKTRTVS